MERIFPWDAVLLLEWAMCKDIIFHLSSFAEVDENKGLRKNG